MLDVCPLRSAVQVAIVGATVWGSLLQTSAVAQTVVEVSPGTSIQAVVDANPPGTTLRLKAGVHRQQTIRPKDGNTFVGDTGAILSGAKVLTNFTRVGSGSSSSSPYLSDLDWTSMSNGWGPVERDRSNAENFTGDGRVITLNGQTYAKGLGTHAPSEVHFPLNGCSGFSASIGVDDEVGTRGTVVFQVWADGNKLYDSGVMNGNSATQGVNLSVANRNELVLIVTNAGDGSGSDHADWADARLSCSSGGGAGAYWAAPGQTQNGPLFGSCQDWSSILCLRTEQLFIDNQPLTMVGSLAEVAPGSWYFDYNGDTIYFGTDPTGRLVETSVTGGAFEPTANNVTISGLVIEKYANVAQKGAIDMLGRTGWVVSNNEVRYNHGAGIRFSARAQVLQNNVHHNGQMGISGTGDSVLIQGNEIAYNNLAWYEVFWEGGGTKFVDTTNLIVRANFAHHNNGPGLWTDRNNVNTLYENNTSEDNAWMGIVHEISYSAVIRNNTVRRNGFSYPDWIAGAGILVAASSNVEVYGNWVELNADGIGAMQQSRGSGPLGPYEISNLWVHDNTIIMSDGWTGLLQDAGDTSYFTSRNNRFDRNHYYLGTNRYYFAWMNAERTETEWRNFSEDVNGTVSR
jgi:parallel beta-helix repeat protein